MFEERRAVAAASALVEREGAVLLVKRGRMPARGKWSLPGGAVRWEEPIRNAVVREVLEETGVLIEVGQVLDVVDVFYREGGQLLYHYVVVCFAGKYLRGDLKPGSDAEDARWVQTNDLRNYDITPTAWKVITRVLGIKQ
ncbi:GDP-mannose mannosyl hydrolase [Candidatus Calditenuaceae archaeon HR02]|nr:GDP-mannose mannosyl hydrolase [Candidatus Calditenuaceae archaeon HR02]